jgi:peptide/nickel transport system substrate-binding protein
MSDSMKIDYLFAQGRTTRRGFIAGAMALGLGSTAASDLWSVASAQAAAPKRGGLLRAGLIGGSTSDVLDPTTFDDTFMISLSNSVRDHLVDVGYDNALEPALAESWETSPDAKSWRFKLRHGVEFSDGKPLTTDDVIGSINLHRGESSKSGAKGLFQNVADVKADGKDVVVVTLATGNSDFPYLLTDYHLPIVPAKDGKADPLSAVGTGLYKLESFRPGVSAELKRNANAWQADQLGFFDEARLVVIADNTARQNAITDGEVDTINRPELRLMSRLVKVPSLRAETVTSNTHYTLPMHIDIGPFDNADFRTAIKYALNREEFIKKVFFGYGNVGNDNPIGPGFRFHDASLPQRPFDPDKAKHHIEKSGLSGVSVNLSAADVAFVGAVDAALLLADVGAKIGVNINVVREPSDGYWSNIWLKKPWCACYWGSRPVEDMILSIAYLSGAPWNDTHIKLDQLDQLISVARAEIDETKRRQHYSDIQQIISNEGGSIVPAFAKEVILLSKKVATTGKYGGTGWEMDGGHFVKRWWAA